MSHCQSIDAITDASVDELARVEGMNAGIAADVYNFFHKSADAG